MEKFELEFMVGRERTSRLVRLCTHDDLDWVSIKIAKNTKAEKILDARLCLDCYRVFPLFGKLPTGKRNIKKIITNIEYKYYK